VVGVWGGGGGGGGWVHVCVCVSRRVQFSFPNKKETCVYVKSDTYISEMRPIYI